MKNPTKIICLTLILILSTAFSASALQLCVKNSKKYNVVNGRVNVKLPQIVTVGNGVFCPEGYTEVAELSDFAGGTTMTGVWNLSGGPNENYAAASISFPKALPDAPSNIEFIKAGTVGTNCTGSVAAPSAPPGVLCIYEEYADNLKADFSSRYYTYDPTDSTSMGSDASRFGAALYGYSENPDRFYAWGVWSIGIPAPVLALTK